MGKLCLRYERDLGKLRVYDYAAIRITYDILIFMSGYHANTDW